MSSSSVSSSSSYTLDADYAQTDFIGYFDDPRDVIRSKAAVNTGWTQYPEARFRVRFAVEEYLGQAKEDQSIAFQYRKNGGSWAFINSVSAVVRSVESDYITDDERDDVSRVYQGVKDFVGGVLDETGSISGAGASVEYTGNDVWEFETCVKIREGDVAEGDTVEIRAYNLSDTKALDRYDNIPVITISKTYPEAIPFRRQKTVRYFRRERTKRYFLREKTIRWFRTGE